MQSANFKSGFVAIIGKPNVGKSTLLNSILHRKIAIVSERPETTRDNIQGILTTKKMQAIFIDTPGIHKPYLLLGKLMVKRAKSSLLDADIILFLVELTSGLQDADFMILDLIKESKKVTLLVINKIDMVNKGNILPLIDEIKKHYNFIDYIPISALCGDNIELLTEKISENLPEGEKYYPDGQITDKEDTFHAAEVIREKAILATREEVPHSIAVSIERFVERNDKGILDIDAIIYIERESQKGILIGKKGDMIKNIATLSREELEKMFKQKVFLQIWVKVLKNWRKNPVSLKRLGMD